MARISMPLMPLVGGQGRLHALMKQTLANLMLRRGLSVFSPLSKKALIR